MAVANIPPAGGLAEAEKRRLRRIREDSTIDPVERYKLRERRLWESEIDVATEMVRQAKNNHITINNLKGVE